MNFTVEMEINEANIKEILPNNIILNAPLQNDELNWSEMRESNRLEAHHNWTSQLDQGT